jgi:hypothetical protein
MNKNGRLSAVLLAVFIFCAGFFPVVDPASAHMEAPKPNFYLFDNQPKYL